MMKTKIALFIGTFLSLISVSMVQASPSNLKSFTGSVQVYVNTKPALKDYTIHFYGKDDKECIVKGFKGEAINFPNDVGECAATLPILSKIWFKTKDAVLAPQFNVKVTGDQSEGRGIACNITVTAKTSGDSAAKIVDLTSSSGDCSVAY